MNNPDMYRKFNMLKGHKKLILEKYLPKMNWRVDGSDTILEIGCGGGDLTNDVILPLIQNKFSRYIGSDINQNMVEYAQKMFGRPNVFFDRLDISGDIGEFLIREKPFDHIISMICLHLIPDQRNAMKNILNLLNSNGDCLLYILSYNREADFFRDLHGKWGKYMVNIDNYVSPYYNRIYPAEMAGNFMKNAGFTKCIVDEISETIVFDDLEIFKGAVNAITPYADQIPKDLQEDYNNDLVKVAVNNENKVVMPYKMLMVYGQK